MLVATDVLYVFEPYVLDTALRTLTCHGERVPLQPKTLEVLQYLIDHGAGVVSRQELFEAVWGDEEIAESNLTQHVFMLRQAFAECTPDQTFVVTISGKGYRFVRDCVQQSELPLRGAGDEWRAYVRGCYFADRRTRESLQKAFVCFEDSLTRNPGLARAHAGLGHAHLLYAQYLYGEPAEHFARARACARRALELDPGSADAIGILGEVAFFYDWDRRAADDRYGSAVALAPASLRLRLNRAWFLAACARHEEAAEQVAVALRQHASELNVLVTAGALAIYAGRPADAVTCCRDVLAMDDRHELGLYYLSMALAALGQYDEAWRTACRGASGHHAQGFEAIKGYCAGMRGDSEAARWSLAEIDARADRSFVSSFNRALVLLGMRDFSGAVAALRRGLLERDPWLVFVEAHPCFGELRGRSDVKALVRAIAPAAAAK